MKRINISKRAVRRTLKAIGIVIFSILAIFQTCRMIDPAKCFGKDHHEVTIQDTQNRKQGLINDISTDFEQEYEGNSTQLVSENDSHEMETYQYLCYLNSNDFKDMSEEAQISIYEKVIEYESNHLNIRDIPSLVIEQEMHIEDMDGALLGIYKENSNEIHINNELLKYSSFTVLSVLFHEIYHALQYQVVNDYMNYENTGNASLDTIMEIRVYEDDIPRWTNEMLHYTNASEGIEEYENQSVEQSAEKYSMDRLIYYVDQGYISIE